MHISKFLFSMLAVSGLSYCFISTAIAQPITQLTGTATIKSAVNKSTTKSEQLRLKQSLPPATNESSEQSGMDSIQGELSDSDEIKMEDGRPIDSYPFSGLSGQFAIVSVESTEFSPILGIFFVTEEGLELVASSSDEDTIKTPEGPAIATELPYEGNYVALVSSLTAEGRGRYVLTVGRLSSAVGSQNSN